MFAALFGRRKPASELPKDKVTDFGKYELGQPTLVVEYGANRIEYPILNHNVYKAVWIFPDGRWITITD